MDGITRARAGRDGLERMRKRALEVLNRTDLGSVYDAAEMGGKIGGIDVAVKVILAEKLVDSLCTAKRYAKKMKMKDIGASALLIAAQENRW